MNLERKYTPFIKLNLKLKFEIQQIPITFKHTYLPKCTENKTCLTCEVSFKSIWEYPSALALRLGRLAY